MLVSVAELVEDPQQVPFGFAPAVMERLDAGYNIPSGVAETTDLPQPARAIRILKLRLVFEDGEFRSARGVSVIRGAEGIDGVVKGGSETVNDLSDDDAPLRGRRPLNMDATDLLAGLSVYI